MEINIKQLIILIHLLVSNTMKNYKLDTSDQINLFNYISILSCFYFVIRKIICLKNKLMLLKYSDYIYELYPYPLISDPYSYPSNIQSVSVSEK